MLVVNRSGMLQEPLKAGRQRSLPATDMAIMRRFSSADDEECSQDEDALLKSKWSLAMFSEVHSEQRDIAKLGQWLQVETLYLHHPCQF